MTGQLDSESQQQYPELNPAVSIHKATLNLIRETRRLAFCQWPANHSIASLFKAAKVGDRFLVQFDDVELHTHQGQSLKLDNSKLIQITVRE